MLLLLSNIVKLRTIKMKSPATCECRNVSSSEYQKVIKNLYLFNLSLFPLHLRTTTVNFLWMWRTVSPIELRWPLHRWWDSICFSSPAEICTLRLCSSKSNIFPIPFPFQIFPPIVIPIEVLDFARLLRLCSSIFEFLSTCGNENGGYIPI